MASRKLLITVLSLLLILLAVNACGGGQQEVPASSSSSDTESAPAASDGAAEEAVEEDSEQTDAVSLAQQIAKTLKACSYDGVPVSFDISGIAPDDCRTMVEMIMPYTGLPQNFEVTEANIPNAAAVILLDEENLPQRVIGFNPEFIALVNEEVANPWGAVSIMAHEIAHHLAGHTIQPGGSQPPTELEADKFSGFVLQKMGAGLDDALIAMRTLVPPEGSETHPGRADRVAAITEGWMESCEQIGRTDCANGQPGATPQKVVLPTLVPSADTSSVEPTTEPATTSEAPASTIVAGSNILPNPNPNAIPSKFTQFIYDELGILDAATVAEYEQQYFDHAQETGVEIVTLIVDDLHGYSAQEYAWLMMRQLRVGKLDVGNGVVAVYAPNQDATALAFGPAIMSASKKFIDGYIELAESTMSIVEICVDNGECSASNSGLIFLGMSGFVIDTANRDYRIRYSSFNDLHTEFIEAYEAGNFSDDPTNRAVTRFQGTVEAINVEVDNELWRLDVERFGYMLVSATGANEENLNLYVLPDTMSLQPSGELEVGKTYTFVGIVSSLNVDVAKPQLFEVFSYDLID